MIRGLGRPLFGVMAEAEVENLFLSEALIEHPFTYYDGERYVDGYGASPGPLESRASINCNADSKAVSYTHLDVYKRQVMAMRWSKWLSITAP